VFYPLYRVDKFLYISSNFVPGQGHGVENCGDRKVELAFKGGEMDLCSNMENDLKRKEVQIPEVDLSTNIFSLTRQWR